ncbi:hypothetical protein Aduo_003219 [Ancylostoma duodenale]
MGLMFQERRKSQMDETHKRSTNDEHDSTTIIIIAAAGAVVVLIFIVAIIGLIYERGKQKKKRLLKEQLDKEEEKSRKRKKTSVSRTNKKKSRKRHKADSDSSESVTEKKKKRTSQRPSGAQANAACDPKKALVNYLEAQLETCRLAVDSEKAGGDTAIKPADLKDDGYFGVGTPRQEEMKYLLVLVLLTTAVGVTTLDCPDKGEIPYISLVERGPRLCQFHCVNVGNCKRGVCVRVKGKKMRQCDCRECDPKVPGRRPSKRG